jgi:hypothetical protein
MRHTKPGRYYVNWHNGYWESVFDGHTQSVYTVTPPSQSSWLGKSNRDCRQGMAEYWVYKEPPSDPEIETDY